jgi:hypothetical protein
MFLNRFFQLLLTRECPPVMSADSGVHSRGIIEKGGSKSEPPLGFYSYQILFLSEDYDTVPVVCLIGLNV